jgi:hypothetical protein
MSGCSSKPTLGGTVTSAAALWRALFDLAGSCSDYWCMARWVEINTGNPVYRIRDDDRVVDINTGNPVYRMRE